MRSINNILPVFIFMVLLLIPTVATSQDEERAIHSVYPTQVTAGTTMYIIISGTGLSTATTVDFGSGTSVLGFTADESELIVNLEISLDAAPGPRDITVSGENFEITFPAGFLILLPPLPDPPEIENIFPNNGVQGENDVRIRLSGTTLDSVEWIEIAELPVEIISISAPLIEIEINIPPTTPLGTYDIKAGGPLGDTTLRRAFEVKPAEITITSIGPAEITRGEINIVTITGDGFQGIDTIRANESVEISILVQSTRYIDLVVTPIDIAPLGGLNLSLSGPGGFLNLENILEIIPGPPEIDSLEPSTAMRGEIDLPVKIIGRNLDSLTSFEILGYGIEISGAGYVDPTELYIALDIAQDAGLDTRDVAVSNVTGEFILENGFTVLAGDPEINNVFPFSAKQGDTGVRVIVSGKNLDTVTGVDFGGGVSVTAFEANSPFNLVCEVKIDPDALPGDRDVTVTSDEGGFSRITDGFTVLEFIPEPVEPEITEPENIEPEITEPENIEIIDEPQPDEPPLIETPIVESPVIETPPVEFSIEPGRLSWHFDVTPGNVGMVEHSFEFTLTNTGEAEISELMVMLTNFEPVDGTTSLPADFFTAGMVDDGVDSGGVEPGGTILVIVNVTIPTYGGLYEFDETGLYTPSVIVKDSESGFSVSAIMEISYNTVQ